MPSKDKNFDLVFSDASGHVFNFEGLRAAGMKAGQALPLEESNFLKLPASSEIFMLPSRLPIGINTQTGKPETLGSDPFSKEKEPCFAVAAFIPPGYALTHNAAFSEAPGAEILPLFAYGAIAFREGSFYVAALRVDESDRHDERGIDMDKVTRSIPTLIKQFPKNRLVPHLANCATVNACANAKNFFLGRYEAPVPVSPVCNAQCQGCISFQPSDRMPSTQSRITFVPTPEEIAELALYHIEHEPDPLVSFGQGCEGEPTLSGDVIEKAIRLIRRQTSKGSINVNTNASRPQVLGRLFEAGLTNVRVSTNSVREPYYSRYYQPRGYSFKEVAESVRIAKKAGGFVSMNYLSMPGFTDSRQEFEAFAEFIQSHSVDMVQWRNLNYDPLQYFRDLKLEAGDIEMLGIGDIIRMLEKKIPSLRMGYFNPRKTEERAVPKEPKASR